MIQNWNLKNTWLIVCIRNLGEMFYKKGYCEVSEWYDIPFFFACLISHNMLNFFIKRHFIEGLFY